MTPAQWIGHSAFRVVVSERFPPRDTPCHAHWMQHLDGTLVLLCRGMIPADSGQYKDVLAREAFGDACHCCVKVFSDGMLHGGVDCGDYKPYWSTTDRKPKYNPWGSPCDKCAGRMAADALEEAVKTASKFGFDVSYQLEKRG